jgi:hypothetical protein
MNITRKEATTFPGAMIAILLASSFFLVSIGVSFNLIPITSSNASSYTPQAQGELDCNGRSTIQQAVRPAMLCTDIRGIAGIGNQYTWGGRFYDNGYYVGHDEPDMTFLSNKPGSGNDVTWTEVLGSDPSASPTVATPGSDVSHWFELSVAPWFSMMLCDGNSYPQLPCTPESDANAPTCFGLTCTTGQYPGAGSAFMELQFYPPGFAPFVDSISCDNSHWCSALSIDSLECTLNYANCNPSCIEPVNFAFIQTNGVPAGPPSPQLADLSTFTPNSNTLLMNPGDMITVHMSDAPVPGGGGNAFKVVITDLTNGESGFMQASAVNGFMQTSIANCQGTPFNFEPEYYTAAAGNIAPWSALQTDISTQFEIGHFTGCTTLSGAALLTIQAQPTILDRYYNVCSGPYESSAPGGDGGSAPEVSDALCYPISDTHRQLHSSPDTMTGCLDDLYQNGDLDFDGSPYWAEWPTSASPSTYPASFVQSMPLSGGHDYPQYFIQTDVALSESTCPGPAGPGCSVPPPNAPGSFYPYWSLVRTSGAACKLEFGNVASGAGVNNLGKDAQYGTDLFSTLGYPEFEGVVQPSVC